MGKEKLSTDILINGAGPTGLMLACQLAVNKVSFRIIDKKYAPSKFSGAMIIHAQSLEMFHQMGLSKKILSRGTIAQKITFKFGRSSKMSFRSVEFGGNLSLFPYMVLLEQNILESILEEYIRSQGYEVERGTTLLSFSQDSELVKSVLKKPDESGEIVNSRFLIGAGGSTSLVRRQLRIPFYGVTHPELLFVTDCQANVKASPAEMIFAFTGNQVLGFFPLPGNRWRVDGHVPATDKRPDEITFDYVEESLSRIKNLELKLINPTWFSVFRSHSRYAPAFKHINCFLIGDAAHIHSPVGAQGMNTGLADACNLAWKLAFYVKGFARESLLDTYQEERLPVSKNIIKYSDFAFKLVASNNEVLKYLRSFLLPLVLRLVLSFLGSDNKLRRYLFRAISGLNVRYRKSSLSGQPMKINFLRRSPQPGDRFPCMEYFVNNVTYHLHDLIKNSSFTLLLFGSNEVPAELNFVLSRFGPVIDVKFIPVDPGTNVLFDKFAMYGTAMYLIRPDFYICWCSDEFDALGLDIYLKQFFKTNAEVQGI